MGIITPDSILLLLSTHDNDIGKLKMVNVYPNPTSKAINFHFTELNIATEEILIEIRNLPGQLVMEKTGVMNESITLNIDDISPGIYIYIIKSDKIIVQQGKLVIQ
jgi:hypothetical protein